MTEKELFAKKAVDGYFVCYSDGCPRKEQCLRWLVGLQMPDTRSFITNVNLRSEGVGVSLAGIARRTTTNIAKARD